MKILRTRNQYSRISNTKKKVLIHYVICKKIKLCKAAKLLDIKYSTAKTIMRIYRKENKIFTKNFDEEKSLKKILIENKRNYQNNIKLFYLFKDKRNSKKEKLVANFDKGKLTKNR